MKFRLANVTDSSGCAYALQRLPYTSKHPPAEVYLDLLKPKPMLMAKQRGAQTMSGNVADGSHLRKPILDKVGAEMRDGMYAVLKPDVSVGNLHAEGNVRIMVGVYKRIFLLSRKRLTANQWVRHRFSWS